jgi:predicted MPP superfamily phosphohydrolase
MSVASISAIFSISYLSDKTNTRYYVFSFLVMLFVSKLLIVLFFFVDDIRRFGIWILHKFTQPKPHAEKGSGISRSVFLSWMGGALGTLFFGSMAYGFSNKYNYKIKRVNLHFSNLPDAFNGMKIVQISDIHSGSFSNKAAVNKGMDMILKENADIILFTGDLVNNRAEEMNDYIDVFNRLKAPMGVYSILGNHDYGDYVQWDTEKAKQDNLEQLKNVHAQMGWRLLLNEHVVLEKENEQIALLGIENWSAMRNFSRHGKLNEAHAGTEKYPFKILMSHDPTHWDAEVRPKYPDIDLTLSGHTHGMQFGVELPHFRWSPVKWV